MNITTIAKTANVVLFGCSVAMVGLGIACTKMQRDLDAKLDAGFRQIEGDNIKMMRLMAIKAKPQD